MVLKTVQDGELVDIPIGEGEIFLLPPRIPHSPQRMPKSVGIVVERARGGYAGQATALALTGIALGPAVPNATGRVAFLAPALGELIQALGYAPASRPATGLAMAALMGFGQMGAVFLTSSTTAVPASRRRSSRRPVATRRRSRTRRARRSTSSPAFRAAPSRPCRAGCAAC